MKNLVPIIFLICIASCTEKKEVESTQKQSDNINKKETYNNSKSRNNELKPKLTFVDTITNNEIILLTKPQKGMLFDFKYLDSILFPFLKKNIPDSLIFDKRGEYKSYNFIFNYNKDNLFKLSLNHKDSVYFIIDLHAEKIAPYLIFSDTIYRLPKFSPEECCVLESINAISFNDLNSDGYTDIIIIAQFYSGVGPINVRYEPRYCFDIYFGSPNGFYKDNSLIYSLDLEGNKGITIGDIKEAYKKAQAPEDN